MAEPTGIQFSDDDRRRAKVFFDRGATVAATGQYDYAIEMFLQGLSINPEDVDAHQALREIALKRKATGGKAVNMLKAMGINRPGKDDKVNMLNQEKLLAFDPGSTGYMVGLLQYANRAQYVQTVLWIGPILQRANADDSRPDANKFIILKDVYKDVHQFQLAIDALALATQMRPDDMDLQRELKDLAARNTMKVGNYEKGDFRESIRDKDSQEKLMEADKDVREAGAMSRVIADAEKQHLAEPNDGGKFSAYITLLVKSDDSENENKAIELLEQWFNRTKQFRYRLKIGEIKLKQLKRIERTMLESVRANPQDEELARDYKQFAREKTEEELNEFKLASEAYPTEMRYRFEMAKRLVDLERHDEAIPVFQAARNDPKLRTEATMMLGRAFLSAEYVEEAVDTLKALIDIYEPKGDLKSMEMTYWYGRALEKKPDTAAALKSFSQVAMIDFNYKDVQARIKRLRAAATSSPGAV